MPSITHQGIRIHYEADGAGPAVVFLHSFLCSGAMFVHQVEALRASHRTVNVDLRGHGLSASVPDAFSLYDMVDDVIAVLDAEGIGQAVWVGLSIGGFIAMRAALVQPTRVRALVLMDTEAPAQSVAKKVQDMALKGGLRLFGARRMVPTILPSFLGPTTRRTQPGLCEEYAERFAEIDVPSICHGIDAVKSRDDVLPRLGEIACPTLVMVGAEDQPLPPAKSRQIAEGIPGARMMVIPDAGHLSAVEQPGAVNTALRAFLETLP